MPSRATHHSDNPVGTTFDALGRVTGVSNALGAFTYAYVDETSRLSGMTYPSGTGLSTIYSYFGNTSSDSNPADDDQRLETIQNMKGSTQLSKFDYTYNHVGTIATWTQQADSSTAVVNTLSYDNADQLTSDVQSGGGSASNAYAYDPAGNRLAETTGSGTTAGQFNKLNQLTGYGGTTSQTVAGNTSAAATNVVVNAVPATISDSTNFTVSVPLPNGTNTVTVMAQPGLTNNASATQRYQIVVSGTLPTQLAGGAGGLAAAAVPVAAGGALAGAVGGGVAGGLSSGVNSIDDGNSFGTTAAAAGVGVVIGASTGGFGGFAADGLSNAGNLGVTAAQANSNAQFGNLLGTGAGALFGSAGDSIVTIGSAASGNQCSCP